MLISFIGSPGSGKTTIATMLFSFLKESGVICDFISEQARIYIAELRFNNEISPTSPITLTDHDQMEILSRQNKIEKAFVYSYGQFPVISDSCPLNALFYMTPDFRQDNLAKILIKQSIERSNIFFFSPFNGSMDFRPDVNRVHTPNESIEINKNIYSILNNCCPEVFPKVIALQGNIQTRFKQALKAVIDEMEK